VKRLLAVVLGAIGLGALMKRRHPAPAAPDGTPADDLRAKLAETKVEPEPAPEPDVAARRADVHDRARQAIDELKTD
jgi:hypothetical protein